MISDVLGKLVTVKMFFNHVKQSNKVPQKSPDLQNVTDFSVTLPPPLSGQNPLSWSETFSQCSLTFLYNDFLSKNV